MVNTFDEEAVPNSLLLTTFCFIHVDLVRTRHSLIDLDLLKLIKDYFTKKG